MKKILKMKNLILASTSPRRKKILTQLGLKYKAVSPDYEEDMTLKVPPLELAKILSKGKAEAVAKDYRNHVIIAADTFIALDNEVLGKPFTEDKAKETLRKISNKVLSVISGLTIIDTENGKQISKAVETKVYIKDLTESEIENYIKTGEPLDKAGAFGIQDMGAVIVKKVEGDYSNVIGLPIYELSESLKEFGINIL